MAGSLTNYLETRILDHMLGGADYNRPATVWCALFTASPGETGTLTAEVTGGGYARVAIVNNTINFPASTAGAPSTKANGADITFPTATANQGTIAAFALMDAATTGNALIYGDLTTPKPVTTGDTPKFLAGDLTFTID